MTGMPWLAATRLRLTLVARIVRCLERLRQLLRADLRLEGRPRLAERGLGRIEVATTAERRAGDQHRDVPEPDIVGALVV